MSQLKLKKQLNISHIVRSTTYYSNVEKHLQLSFVIDSKTFYTNTASNSVKSTDAFSPEIIPSPNYFCLCCVANDLLSNACTLC